MRVGIVGAGMAGLACARQLSWLGVRLFDKGRRPGGRMSTRRVEVGGETLHFDHGAQYFTARDPEFVAFVNHWLETANAAPWKSASDDAFVVTRR